MHRLKLLPMLLAAGGLLLCRCGTSPIAGGTSTSENGRVAGTMVTAEGTPAPNTQITLLPADYDPVKSTGPVSSDTTDETGGYSFSQVAPGNYTLQCVQLTTRIRALRNGVAVNGDTAIFTGDTLRRPGSIRIALPENVDTVAGYLYIPGTGIAVKLAGAATFAVLDSVPAGTISAVAYASTTTAGSSVLHTALAVTSQDTVLILVTGWKHNRRIQFNTTASGADIPQTVVGFPVLIRLTHGNFDFGQAHGAGNDLRFLNPEGTPLSMEIERWDALNGSAEIWVRVDSIRGNDSSGFITMYWGNPRVRGEFGPNDVFDSTAGYSAIWHLEESSDTLHDVSANRADGFRNGSLSPISGMIGNGQQFGSSGAYVEMENVLNPGNGPFTLSAWVKRAATGLQTIMAKSNGGSPAATYGWSLSFGLADQLHFFAATAGPSWGSEGAFDVWAKTESTVTDTITWHFVAVVIDRSNSAACRVFLDGTDVTGGFNGDITKVGSLVNTTSLRIGAEADGDYKWTGGMDECVLSHTVRSAAWLRLCYINQGRNDQLIEFR